MAPAGLTAITWSTIAATCYATNAGTTTANTSCRIGSIYPDTVSVTTRTASQTAASGIGTGSANTLAIIARHDALTPTAVDKALYAAGSADNYSNTPSGGTAVTDWFLPSYGELEMLIHNYAQFKPTLNMLSATCTYYQTSSESFSDASWIVKNTRTYPWTTTADVPTNQLKVDSIACILPIRQF